LGTPLRDAGRGRARPLPAGAGDGRAHRLAQEVAVKLVDVSVPIREVMPIYDRNPGVHIERARAIAAGTPANITRRDLGSNTGTHVDGPLHFFEDGAGVETLDPNALMGQAHVVDATALNDDIDSAAIDRLDIPGGAERLIFKTPNSELW